MKLAFDEANIMLSYRNSLTLMGYKVISMEFVMDEDDSVYLECEVEEMQTPTQDGKAGE